MTNIDNYRLGILDWVESYLGDDLSSIAKGNAFCQWCLENIFNLSSDEALDAREVSGGYDHGIDAFILMDEKVIVVQTKFENAHSLSEITKFHYDMDRIKEGKVRPSEASDNAHRVIADIQDSYESGWRVEYYYITNAEFTANEKSKIQDIAGYGVDFHIYDLQDIFQQLDRKQQDVPDTVNGKWFNLPLSNREILKFAGTTAVIVVSLGHMHDFVSQATDDLFASNVRQYLRGTKINRGIRNTILNNPDRFWLYNNGITIVCDDFLEEGFSLKIQTPQIVNGCQTAKSILDILSKKREQDRHAIPGHVLVRIIKGADETEKENITRYTNTQNAVRGRDFFSLEQFQKKLARSFKTLDYYYEIQRGSFAALKPSERDKYRGRPNLQYLVTNRFKGLIQAQEAIQAFAAAYRQIPAIAYGVPYELVPGGTWYDKVFDDDLPADAKLFLYPFLVRECARKNGYSRGSEGGWRAHSALYFVFAYFVIVMEFLKRLNYADALEVLPDKIPMEIWDKIFQNAEVNQRLLALTDEILERYFTDSKVDEAVGLDVRKFLKSHELLTRYKSVLLRLVPIVMQSARNRDIVEQLSSVLNSE
jgi:hypothetical protein